MRYTPFDKRIEELTGPDLGVLAEVLPFDDATARLAGRINGDLVRKGRVIGMPDVMIAAVALRASIPIVSGNQAHFEQIRAAGYDLAIENWRIP